MVWKISLLMQITPVTLLSTAFSITKRKAACWSCRPHGIKPYWQCPKRLRRSQARQWTTTRKFRKWFCRLDWPWSILTAFITVVLWKRWSFREMHHHYILPAALVQTICTSMPIFPLPVTGIHWKNQWTIPVTISTGTIWIPLTIHWNSQQKARPFMWEKMHRSLHSWIRFLQMTLRGNPPIRILL